MNIRNKIKNMDRETKLDIIEIDRGHIGAILLAVLMFTGVVVAFPSVSAGINIDLNDSEWNFYSGETIIKEIEICHDLTEREVFLTYIIENNVYDLEGLTFSFSENPVTFKGCKKVNFI